MTALALVAVPLVGAIACLFLRRAGARLAVARWASVAMAAVAVVLVLRASAGEPAIVHFGGWAPPLGIAFQVDRLGGLFSLLLSLVLVATVWTLSSADDHRLRRLAPGSLFLAAALAGAFATSDLFNLFVMFELVLVSSYLLLQSSGEGARKAAAPYVVMNVVASLSFFVGAGMLYRLAGSLSLPDLAAVLPGVATPWKTTGVALLTIAFATKAGLAPLMFWLPRTYPHLFGPIAALFAGMMTKLGVYALLRTVPLMEGTVLPEILLWAGALSALVGVLAAQAQSRLRELLGFHIVSQVGFMVAGVGLASVAGLAGAIFYVAHHVLVKTALFLLADVAENRPSTGEPTRVTGLPHWLLLPVFLLAGLSLAGMPPLSGFVGKIAVFQALLESPRPAVIAVLLVSSLFTLVSILKMWRSGFSTSSPDGERRRVPAGAALLVAASVVLAVAAGPVHRFAEEAAAELVDRGARVAEVGR